MKYLNIISKWAHNDVWNNVHNNYCKMQEHPLMLHWTNLIFMINKAYHRWNWNVEDAMRFYANQVSGLRKWWIMINVGTWVTASIFGACHNRKFAMLMMSLPSTTDAYLDSYTMHCIMNLNYWIISANMRWTKFSAGKEARLFAYLKPTCSSIEVKHKHFLLTKQKVFHWSRGENIHVVTIAIQRCILNFL